MKTRPQLASLVRPVADFARSRRGGAMLIGGSLAMLVMAGTGGMLSNYGWREAQNEEINAAMRASIAASSHFMRGNLAASDQELRERISSFMRGLLGDLTISADDVVVRHDYSTHQTTIGIGADARYRFSNLWAGGDTEETRSLGGKSVTVVLTTAEFEFALALDVSPSMGNRPSGWSETPLDALKEVTRTIAQTVDALSKTNPGVINVSVVPYANVVNVADTSGTARTDAKERYVHMLTGAKYSTVASRDTDGHWVDTFHHYGSGADMGPLASRSLPDFHNVNDWNLHRAGTEDISAQASTIGSWDFLGSDFWNGCVMARWGAYWNPDARPVIWDRTDADNWPARNTVAGWAPGSAGLVDLPLHLSDAPPDSQDPNARFTAYSWPDARIAASADYVLNEVMLATLDPAESPLLTYRGASENHWHLRSQDRGGSLLCPRSPILPLTDDSNALAAVDNYETVRLHSLTRYAQTFLHLGVVWGLRTLSPLWRDVWGTTSVSGEHLPRTPCAGEQVIGGCSPSVRKAIVIVSDGANYFSQPYRGRTFQTFQPDNAITGNPNWTRGGLCSDQSITSRYRAADAAWSEPVAADFATHFEVDQRGVFTPAGLSRALDGFQATHPRLSALDPTDPAELAIIDQTRADWTAALNDFTPWQLFRGHDEASPVATTDPVDVLTNPANDFGLPGRPVHNSHFCRAMTPFSAYGRADDLVRVGDAPPVLERAPFSVDAWLWSSNVSGLGPRNRRQLDSWFRQACTIAGQRDVHIEAIYIGTDIHPEEKRAISLLEECVDRSASASLGTDQVHVTPNAEDLKATIRNIVTIRRTLRFL